MEIMEITKKQALEKVLGGEDYCYCDKGYFFLVKGDPDEVCFRGDSIEVVAEGRNGVFTIIGGDEFPKDTKFIKGKELCEGN